MDLPKKELSILGQLRMLGDGLKNGSQNGSDFYREPNHSKNRTQMTTTVMNLRNSSYVHLGRSRGFGMPVGGYLLGR